ncbi:MAG TPA: PDZ domain-containing protein, partial [Chromatiaceae bacterium]|nr:PDZ domain-containing protein [Chromatiaceae bacterium]
DPKAADFLLYPRGVALPAAGLLGVLLDTDSKGEGVAVKGFSENSGAKAAGMEEADRIVRVGETTIAAYADLRIALVDSRPGQRIPVEVLRKPLLGSPDRVDLEVELH